jgi:replication-associated recombination protein RarA
MPVFGPTENEQQYKYENSYQNDGAKNSRLPEKQKNKQSYSYNRRENKEPVVPKDVDSVGHEAGNANKK